MLIKSFTKIYKGIVEVIAWIMLLVGIIIGGVIGNAINYSDGIVAGCLIGLVVTLLIEIICLPPLYILFQIHSEIEKTNKILLKTYKLNEKEFESEDDEEIASEINNSEAKSGEKNVMDDPNNPNYEFVVINGRKFAKVKGSAVENYYCPYCYTQLGVKTSICTKCNKSLEC